MLTVDTPGGASEQHREESVGASGEATWSDDEGEAGQVPARPEQPPEPPQPAKAPIANNAAGSEPPPADDGQAGQGEPGSGPGEPVTQMDIDEPAASSQGPAEDTEDSCAPDAESEAENGPSVTSFMVPSRLLNSAFLETVSDELPPDEDRDDSSYFATKLPPPVSILKPASWGIFLPVSFSTAMSLDAAKLEEWNVRSVIVADRALLSGRVLQDRFAELCGLGRTEGAERMTGWGSVKSSVVWSPRIAGFLKEKFEAWKVRADRRVGERFRR